MTLSRFKLGVKWVWIVTLLACPHVRAGFFGPRFRYLAFEGGGVKGIAYGGAVRALEAHGVLDDIEGFAGSSAGSQAAALLAAGCTGEELLAALMGMDFSRLLDASSHEYVVPAAIARRFESREGEERRIRLANPLEDLWRLATSFGWYKGEALERAIDELIARKTGRRNCTFAQLHALTRKELRLTGTCVTTGELAWFDRALGARRARR